MSDKVVILIDGGFLKVKLYNQLRREVTATDICSFCTNLMGKPQLNSFELFRTYYYDARPLSGEFANPLDGSVKNFGHSASFRRNQSLIASLELQDNFAVRLGTLAMQGWELKREVLTRVSNHQEDNSRSITAADIRPAIRQKGVDMKIGLDIAWIALKGFAQRLVLVTGDSDFIPVMKFARKEGMKVYLESLGHGVNRELKVHADIHL